MRCLALLGVVLSGCEAGGDRAEPAPVVVGPLLAERMASLEPDDFALARPDEITLTEDGILVLDAGNHRVVHFSRQLEPRGSFGREGGGPGEFRYLADLAYSSGKIFVSDAINMRVTTFSPEGKVVAEHPLPSNTDEGEIAVTVNDTVVAAVVEDGFYLARPAGDQRWTHFASRSGYSTRGYHVPTWGWSQFNVVTQGRGDTLHVLDNATGRVLTTTTAGERISELLLPDSLMRFLVERNHRMNVSLVGEEKAALSFAPPFKEFRRGPDGSVLMIYSAAVGERIIGALLDPRTGAMRPLLLPVDGPRDHPLRRISSAAIRNDSLFVTMWEGIQIYRLSQ